MIVVILSSLPVSVKPPRRVVITDGVKKATVHVKNRRGRKKVLFYKRTEMQRCFLFFMCQLAQKTWRFYSGMPNGKTARRLMIPCNLLLA